MKMGSLTEVANVIIEILVFYNYLSKLFEYKSKAHLVVGYAISAVMLSIVSIHLPTPLALVSMTFSIIFLSSILCFNGKLRYKIFYSVLMMVIIFTAESVLVGLLTLMNFGEPVEFLNFGMGRIIGMIGTNLLYFWFTIYVYRVLKRKVKELPAAYWIMIILMPIISVLILSVVFSFVTDSVDTQHIITAILTVGGLLYLNFSVFNFFETYSSRIKLAVLEQVVKRENENYKLLEQSYNEMRTFRHDVKNHANVLSGLLSNDNNSAAREYLKGLYDTVESAEVSCCTGNPAIDSIINIKGNLAKSKGISFMTKINIGVDINEDTVEICRILGNALDNSIEACEKLPDNEEKYVCISMQNIDERLMITVSNPSDYVDTEELSTTKTDKSIHGIGIVSIKRSVMKMGGIVTCEYRDGVFMLNILLKGV